MLIRPITFADKPEWLRMRLALWPDSSSDKELSEIDRFLADPAHAGLPSLGAVFVCDCGDARLCGMIEASIRPYADGCETNHVGYLEGWYVDPDMRSQGIGRALVAAAEQWALAQGCREVASDAELENTTSQAAHTRLGYQETGRIVQFVKKLT